MLSTAGAVAAIAVMAIITFLTRALPFLLFDRGESPPKLVLYLGRVLPPAIIAMLIVYCLKGVSFATPAGWVPALLASAAALELGEVAVETLRKGRNTEAQSGLDGDAARRANVLGVYEAVDPERISGHRILLVDDICTTGATLAECARVLREAGAADVVCAAAALTPLERDSGKKA